MLELGTTVITVDDMDRAGAFWRGALGYENRSAPSDDWVILDPPGGRGRGPSIALSKTGYPQHYPPRLHLDLYASDQAAELDRLRGLGARDVEWNGYPPDADYVVMEDTEGNRFCVVDAPEWFTAR